MAVIKDVAKLAGVSVSAVSKYLRTPQNMRPDTRERIAAAIDVLHYQPSQLAQSLRTGRSGIIAITIPEVDNPYFSDVFNCFQSLCGNNGLLPIMLKTNTPSELEHTTSLLKSGFIDGAICYDAGEAGKLFQDHELRIPLVYMGPLTHSVDAPAVQVDLKTGMLQLCEYLVACGAKTLAYIGPFNDASSSQKFAALRASCQCSTLSLDPDLVYPQCYGYDGGYENCIRLIGSGRALPDVIISEADMIAMGVMKALAENGFRVPGDIMLTGYDNTDISQMSTPSLTTIHIPSLEMCSAALQLLLWKLGDAPRPASEQVVFKTRLVVRGSTRTMRPTV